MGLDQRLERAVEVVGESSGERGVAYVVRRPSPNETPRRVPSVASADKEVDGHKAPRLRRRRHAPWGVRPMAAPFAETDDAVIERLVDSRHPRTADRSHTEGQMSASTRTAPAQLGFGGFATALVAMALIVILAAAVAFAALNGTKVAPATGTGAQNVPFVDHGSRGELSIPVPAYIWHDSDDYAPVPKTAR